MDRYFDDDVLFRVNFVFRERRG